MKILPERGVERAITPDRIARTFRGLVSEEPLWDHANGAIISTNTQARRIGCLLFLIGKIAAGRKTQSMLEAISTAELQELEQNLRSNGHRSGEITQSESSKRHYLDLGEELKLWVRQGAVLSLTNRAVFLLNAFHPHLTQPYPLARQTKIFFINLLFTADYFGIATMASLLAGRELQLNEIQSKYQSGLLQLLQNALDASSNLRFQRAIRDKLIAIKAWAKPQAYGEHLAAPRLNWLVDLGVVGGGVHSANVYAIKSEHSEWIDLFCRTFVPTDAGITAFTLNYAVCNSARPPADTDLELCDMLGAAFGQLMPRASLPKLRLAEVILFLLCSFAHELSAKINNANDLFFPHDINCRDYLYRITAASRKTQAYVIRSQSGAT